MSLGSVLKNPFFSKDREELFNYNLFYEIKKIGLEHNVDFELLEPIIDKNGYDILIKYRQSSKSIQIKCAERDGTEAWRINKRFFRPTDLHEGRTIIQEANAGHIGLGGGVLLIEYFVQVDNQVEIKYFYTDFVCLSFFQRSVRPWTLSRRYVDFVSELFDDTERKFLLPKSIFFEVTIEQFLYLARILPIGGSLKNNDTWLFNYPPWLEFTNNNNIIYKIKDIRVLLLSGEHVNTSIKLAEIFDFGLRNISINGKMTI